MIESRTSKLVAFAAVIATCIYWASPYIAVARFARAAERGDTAEFIERLDIPRLRNSFARQIVRAYPVDPALLASLDPVARQAAGLVAVTYVDAIITEHFAPEAIMRVLADKSGSPMVGAPGISLPTMNDLGGAWDIFMASGFTGLVSFSVDAKTGAGGSYRLGFRLIGGTWRLVSLGLPSEVIAQAISLLRARAQGR